MPHKDAGLSPQPFSGHPAGIASGYGHWGSPWQDPHISAEPLDTPQGHRFSQEKKCQTDGEVGSAGLETMAASPLLWEAWGQIQGRVFAGDQLSSVGENRDPDGHLNISFD